MTRQRLRHVTYLWLLARLLCVQCDVTTGYLETRLVEQVTCTYHNESLIVLKLQDTATGTTVWYNTHSHACGSNFSFSGCSPSSDYVSVKAVITDLQSYPRGTRVLTCEAVLLQGQGVATKHLGSVTVTRQDATSTGPDTTQTPGTQTLTTGSAVTAGPVDDTNTSGTSGRSSSADQRFSDTPDTPGDATGSQGQHDTPDTPDTPGDTTGSQGQHDTPDTPDTPGDATGSQGQHDTPDTPDTPGDATGSQGQHDTPDTPDTPGDATGSQGQHDTPDTPDTPGDATGSQGQHDTPDTSPLTVWMLGALSAGLVLLVALAALLAVKLKREKRNSETRMYLIPESLPLHNSRLPVTRNSYLPAVCAFSPPHVRQTPSVPQISSRQRHLAAPRRLSPADHGEVYLTPSIPNSCPLTSDHRVQSHNPYTERGSQEGGTGGAEVANRSSIPDDSSSGIHDTDLYNSVADFTDESGGSVDSVST